MTNILLYIQESRYLPLTYLDISGNEIWPYPPRKQKKGLKGLEDQRKYNINVIATPTKVGGSNLKTGLCGPSFVR